MFFIMVTVEIGKRANLKTGVTRKQAHQFLRKTNISYPLILTRTYVTPVLRFALWPYYRRYTLKQTWSFKLQVCLSVYRR